MQTPQDRQIDPKAYGKSVIDRALSMLHLHNDRHGILTRFIGNGQGFRIGMDNRQR